MKKNPLKLRSLSLKKVGKIEKTFPPNIIIKKKHAPTRSLSLRKDEIVFISLIILLISVFFIVYYKFNDKYIKLTVIQTDVLFGQIFPETILNEKNPQIEEYEGGIAYIGSQIKSLRENSNNNKEVESYNLLLDSGNTFFGGGSNKNEKINNGNMFVTLMNPLTFNASVVGNSDLDHGIQGLRGISQKADFPILSGNIVYKNTKEIPEFLKPYTIINFSSMRIGIIGLTNPNILKLSESAIGLSNEIEMLPILEVSKKYIQELKSKRVDFIIVLSSIWNTGTEIALASRHDKDINLIVSSTQHEDQFNKPIYVGSIPIIKIPRNSKYIGAMEFIIEGNHKKIVSSDWKLYPINSKRLIPDDKITSLINSNTQMLEKRVLERRIGYSSLDMPYETTKEGIFGDFVCDIVLNEVKPDIVLINSGTLRGFNKGPITLNKLKNGIPYTNNLYTLKLKGEIIKDILDYSLDNSKLVGILQVAGLRLKYDANAPKGEKILDLKIAGADLDLNKVYTVATIEFLLHGGDGHVLFKKAEEIKKLNITVNKLVFDHIKNNESVVAALDGRMMNINNSIKENEEENSMITRGIARGIASEK
ncbi:MAG: bifunctional metallophosphatase/5'-nucleotidase [Oligoflexia bacterium]|nr:bifunctional metallophosphatase/5'-nucleotidase [Oligoflexia bacterium]